jgi:hypothetical protein
VLGLIAVVREGMIKYAGIGSRETPQDVLDLMQASAYDLAFKGALLRSGGAKGADTAFEHGHDLAAQSGAEGTKEIFKADDATPEALELAAFYHPNWNACKPYARKLHARNGFIVLGEGLNDPVDFVVCWTERGRLQGGTAQALRIADDYGIPIHNYGHSFD